MESPGNLMKKHRINNIMKNIIILSYSMYHMRRANLTLGANPIGPNVVHLPCHPSCPHTKCRNNTCDRAR